MPSFMRLCTFYREAPSSMLSLQIHAKVADKPVVITKASIKSGLLFNDVDEIDRLTNDAIFENLALMRYEGDLTKLTFQKALFSLQWRFLITIFHCLSSKNLESTGENGGDQVHLPYDSPLSGGLTSDRAGGSLNLEALYALCTNLSNMVLALEIVNDAQAKEILTLNAKIKKLENRLEALNKGMQSTVSTARLDDDTARLDVSTAMQEFSTAGPTNTPTTSTIFDDEKMTLADTLIKMKDDKAKGVAFKDSESTDRPARSILTLKPLLTIDPKDKGKGVLEEPESTKKMTKSDFDAAQIARDKEVARQLEVELQAEVEKERQREEQASMDYIANLYNEVQLRIYADHELAVRWTHTEYEKYTKLIADFVPVGSEEDERMIRYMNKKAKEESSDKGVENTKKRKEGSSIKRMSKRHKTDVDIEEEEKLKTFLKIDLNEEGVIDYEVLDKIFPIINWESKFYHYDKHRPEGIYYRIFRSDGSSRWIKTFFEMVTRFDRLNLVELYNLVMQKFKSTTPEEDGTEIHMLAEKRYILTTRTLERMLSLRLIAESASDAAYDLLRFIQKQIDESGRHNRGEKDL
nr:hypothetical protein [Tanacetum cinerariifolium]